MTIIGKAVQKDLETESLTNSEWMMAQILSSGDMPNENPKSTESKSDLRHANEFKCVECDEPAVAFWPVIDPDIPSSPRCRKHLDRAKNEVLTRLFGKDWKGLAE